VHGSFNPEREIVILALDFYLRQSEKRQKDKPPAGIMSIFRAGLSRKNSIGFTSVSRQYRAGANFHPPKD
jgi:hypothetical protein